MKRVFISVVSLQPRNGLQTVVYEPYGFSLPKGNVKTGFPLVPIVRNYMRRQEDTKVILIRDNETIEKDTYHRFCEELQVQGVPAANIHPLEILSVPGKKECSKMLLNLLDMIDDDSVIYADITYGKKPVSAMMLYALNLVEKIKDVEVEGIYYGDIHWKMPDKADENDKAVLIDVTTFKYMTDVANELSYLEGTDIYSVLRKLGDIDE